MLALLERGADPEVDAVRFPGASSLDRDLLRAAISTRPSRCRSPLARPFCALGDWDWAEEKHFLSEAEPAADEARLTELYRAWGFPGATVAARVLPEEGDPEDVVVELRVVEGEPVRVRSVALRGLEALDPPVRVPEALPLRPGGLYATPLLDATALRIRRAFAERGHPFAEVEVAGEIDAAGADVVLTADPGAAARFGQIFVGAEAPIQESAVRERLAYRPGEPYRPAALERTERRLRQLSIVEDVEMEPLPVPRGDTLVPTRVTVTARDPQGFAGEGTLSSSRCLELALFWQHRYFLGDPRVLTLGGGVSNLLASGLGAFPCTSTGSGAYAETDYFIDTELRQPLPGSPATALRARVFAARRSTPQVFVARGYGAEIGLAREVAPGLLLSLEYRPQRSELDAAGILFCGGYGICTAEGIERRSAFRWLSPVEGAALWQPRGVPYPRGGFGSEPLSDDDWRPTLRADLAAAGAPTGSDDAYLRGTLEGAAVRHLAAGRQLAARLRLGAVDGDDPLPPQARLFGGGDGMRGVGTNELGPKMLLVQRARLPELGCPDATPGCLEGGEVDPDAVEARPLGGRAVLEASIEGRVPLAERVQAAAFVDVGWLAHDAPEGEGLSLDGGNALISPGLGVRILTGLGLFRVDVAYDPSGPRRFPLVTSGRDGRGFVRLGSVTYRPFEIGQPGFVGELWRRLHIQVGLGQPF